MDFTLDPYGFVKKVIAPLLKLLDFHEHIRRQILNYVLVSDNPITVNLNSDKEHVPVLLYLDWILHIPEFRRYYMLNNFILRIDYNIHDSELFNLGALDWWMSTGDFAGKDGTMAGLKGHNVRNVCLKFKALDGEDIAFEQLRTNTAALMRHGTHLGDRSASVSIRVRHLKVNNELLNETVFTLYSLRFKALCALRKLQDEDLGLQRTIMWKSLSTAMGLRLATLLRAQMQRFVSYTNTNIHS